MLNTISRWSTAGAVACAALVGSLAIPSRAVAAEPMAVVAFSGYDALMQDVNFLGSLGGQPQASQQIEMMLQMFTQNKGLAGLDKTKPIGLVVLSESGSPVPVVCVPVTSADELLGVVKQFGVTVQDMGDGMMQVQTPNMPLFAKTTGGWMHLSIMPTALASAPADTGKLLAGLTDEYDLAARVHVQNVPEAFRQQAIDIISQAAKQSLEQQRTSADSDEDFALREQQMNEGLEQMKEAIGQLDELTFGVSVDSEQARVLIDGSGTAVAGSKLAEDFAKAKKSTTDFAGFFDPKAAMTFCFSAEAAQSDLTQLHQQFATAKKQAEQGIDKSGDLTAESKEAIKSAVGDILSAIEATAEAGKMDGGAVLNLESAGMNFVAGGLITEPAKIESALKKMVEVAEKEHKDDMPTIKWDAAKINGHSFHTLTAPIPADEEEARKMFGDTVEAGVGIGEKSVYFAAGKDWQTKVKAIMDASAASPGKSVPPVEFAVALGQIMDFAKTVAEADDKPMLEMISSMLANEANGRDHVRMVVQPLDNGQRMRIELEEGVLRAIGMGATAAQMQNAVK